MAQFVPKTTRIDNAHARPEDVASYNEATSAEASGDVAERASRRVGLIAGWGDYPIIVAKAMRQQGYQVFCIGVVGHVDPRLAELCDDFEYSGIARIGNAIRYFQRNRVTEVTMVGKIHKVVLFQPWRWLHHFPDLRTVKVFFPHFLTRRKDCKDDTLLGAIVDEFASEGIRFGPATDYAPELLIKQGQLTRLGPSVSQQRDVEFGWHIAKELGRLDIGQTVVVKDQAVMALEAIEGTDLCIRRAGELCKGGGFTVVKVAKPQQDMRFDVPTVGERTLRTMLEAGGRVLAIEADRTIVLEEEEFVALANRHKLIVVALDSSRNISSSRRQQNTDAAQ